MKQILQNLSTGETEILELPRPENLPGHVLIASRVSLISAGTERMLVDFGKANLVNKALQQPEKVKMVFDKIKTDGLAQTIDAVRAKLDQPLALGYCNVGVVVECDSNQFQVGDRVVSNGPHAELVRVPENLCALIPDNVSNEDASFAVLGAIALQGVRLLNPTLGECFVVTGLGMIGLLAVQLLRANGCRVLGVDYDSSRCKLAAQYGAETVDLSKAEDPLVHAKIFSRQRGVDGVLITASTASSEPVAQAAQMCRKRGRVILTGVTGLELSRADFYEKEISFQVSCSYGPGRYDKEYEVNGNDYPIAFVRWTEQRNFEAVLDMMSTGALNCSTLISHSLPITQASNAYELLNQKDVLGVLINYPNSDSSIKDLLATNSVSLPQTNNEQYSEKNTEAVSCLFVGAGNYASRVLIPAFKKAGANLNTLVSSGGLTSVHFGKKLGFKTAATNFSQSILNTDANTVVIATRHNLHAQQVIEALQSKKHVFVEKPLALTLEELNQIENVYADCSDQKLFMVGFNRRFSPLTIEMKKALETTKQPKSFIFTVNAGSIPRDHWIQDEQIGGGRIIGEACHFIDLMRFLSGSKIKNFSSLRHASESLDNASINLQFENGDSGTIHYLSNGSSVFPKERIEVFCNDATLQIDNFRRLNSFGWKGVNNKRLFKLDKGQESCVAEFVAAIAEGKPAPIPIHELLEVSRVSIQVALDLRNS